MLIALACVTLVALAVIAFAYSLVVDHREARRQWALERRELLERIQRPERIPVSAAADEEFEVPEMEPDESDAVGTIHWLEPDEYLKAVDEIDLVGTIAPS